LVRNIAGDRVTAVIAAMVCVPSFGCSSDGQANVKDASPDVTRDTAVVRDSGSVEADFASTCSSGPPTYAPTYSAIYCEILSQSCALAFCHAGTGDYLIITDEKQAYGELVNAPAAGPNCSPSDLKRVDPGHPDRSLMYLKITNPPCGAKMPLLYGDVSGSLDPQPIDQIRQWIEAGALNN
jgi:hypothetical protein